MTTYAERVRKAVDDEEWQKFRRSLRGMDTQSKLNNLKEYYNDQSHKASDFLLQVLGFDHTDLGRPTNDECDVCLQVDNYLKALARGGQLEKGVSLEQALAWDWCLKVRK